MKWSDLKAVAAQVAAHLGITTTVKPVTEFKTAAAQAPNVNHQLLAAELELYHAGTHRTMSSSEVKILIEDMRQLKDLLQVALVCVKSMAKATPKNPQDENQHKNM